jgi:hypothetical protein
MPTSDLYKVNFIHIPKTAGTTIEKYIGTATLEEGWQNCYDSPQHRFASEYPKNNYFTFTVVRNPYDRIISEYHWRNVDEDVNDFVERAIYTADNPEWDRHILPQSNFVDVDGVKVFKYENINALFTILTGLISYPIPRATPKIYEKYILNTSSVELINEFYNEDFKRFSYNKL